ncbi:MAG: transporter substrate-binding domain-containing protein [Oscillospiraceae bacterium]
MKTFRISKIILAAAMSLAVIAMSGCTQGKKILRMATNAEFPPYEYYDGNELVGVDVELAKAIAEDMGYKLEILDMDFGSIIPSLESDKADIAVAALSVTEEKLELIDFSVPYETASQLIIVPNDSDISSVADLKGKRIGVESFTTGDIYVGEIEDVTAVDFTNGSQAIDALKEGKIDAVVIDGEPAKVFVDREPGLKLIDEPLTEEEYAIGVAKGNTALLKKINKSIENLKASGKIDEIRSKYITAE